MSCCPASASVSARSKSQDNGAFDAFVHLSDNGTSAMELLVPGIHCGACIALIEKTLQQTHGITRARVNLSTKRLAVEWRTGEISPGRIAGIVNELGYEARPYEAARAIDGKASDEANRLLRSIAVAGFAAANVMLLSVSVWSGAQGVTRDLFHWLSALIAMPAVAYAGVPFFSSALNALSHHRLNMDVPISLAVILASFMSLYETMVQGHETYFDAALMLLFFLLVGRYLDHMMRDRARSAVTRLLSLNAAGATVIDEDGEQKFIAVADLQPGMIIQVAAGERLPVDGIVISGLSDTDRSIVTGESLPYTSGPGASLEAGVLNLTGPLKIRVTATGSNTFLAGVVRLMEAAEQGKAKYMRIADRAAQIYAPAVHLLAAATFLFWLWWSGGDWHASLVAAISVLIITCPCALGLAVPAVQIVASGLLFQRGILVKDGTVLEQMTGIDTVVFDKTGTLTTGELSLAGDHGASKEEMSVAAGLAAGSTHPLAVALFRQMQASGIRPAPVKKIKELPGEGLTGIYDGKPVKLGDPQWCGATGSDVQRFDGPRTALAIDGKVAAIFSFEYRLRPAVRKTIASLTGQGMKVILLSGDHEDAVAHVAQRAGIDEWKSRLKPQDKAACIAKLQAGGAKVLMVGDGINDAPALAAASASMAPSSASDIGRTAAGLVFTAPGLDAVTTALKISRAANRHVKQNFALAILYNLIAVPVAIAGLATPLVAAIAMSSSSIIVTANALRLRLAAKDASPQKQKRGSAAPLITAASDT